MSKVRILSVNFLLATAMRTEFLPPSGMSPSMATI